MRFSAAHSCAFTSEVCTIARPCACCAFMQQLALAWLHAKFAEGDVRVRTQQQVDEINRRLEATPEGEEKQALITARAELVKRQVAAKIGGAQAIPCSVAMASSPCASSVACCSTVNQSAFTP